ncbi:hypothetical protein FO519_007133 [Halicephalobus sp. NKZ332]|nr:hypothetical protein FO519_007133 [Halicephalobus sp. NKZ332]
MKALFIIIVSSLGIWSVAGFIIGHRFGKTPRITPSHFVKRSAPMENLSLEGLQTSHEESQKQFLPDFDDDEDNGFILKEDEYNEPKLERLSRKRREYLSYVIAKAGETCGQIASERDIPLNYLLRANPKLNCQYLKEGQVIFICRK